MEIDSQVVQADDMLDIDGLEYDVGGAGSTESSHSEENQAAFYLVRYRVPEATS